MSDRQTPHPSRSHRSPVPGALSCLGETRDGEPCTGPREIGAPLCPAHRARLVAPDYPDPLPDDIDTDAVLGAMNDSSRDCLFIPADEFRRD